MTRRPDSLQRLLALRQARLQRAEDALTRQHGRCAAAQAALAAQTARILVHRDMQRQREHSLLDELRARPVTISHIERIRATFAQLDQQAADLERAEQDVDQAMRAAFEFKQARVVDRNRRRREEDKMTGIVAHAHRAARRREELHAEAEQDELARARPILERQILERPGSW